MAEKKYFERGGIAIIAVNRDYDNPYLTFSAVYTNR